MIQEGLIRRSIGSQVLRRWFPELRGREASTSATKLVALSPAACALGDRLSEEIARARSYDLSDAQGWA